MPSKSRSTSATDLIEAIRAAVVDGPGTTAPSVRRAASGPRCPAGSESQSHGHLMRVAVLDNGHRGRARVAVWLMNKLIGRSPDVLKTLVYRPDFFGRHASRALQDIVRGPSPWSVTDRELYAAYTSRLNQCPFCTVQHGAFASAGLGKDVIEAVNADRTTAPVSAEVKAALALIEKFTLRLEELGPDDVETARTAGLSNEAIEHVFDVATIFNLINRLADAFEFNVPDQERLDQDAKVALRFGYRLPQFLFPRP